MSNLGDLDRLFTQIQREKGTLDSVFANAGVTPVAPLGNITEEHYDSLFTINVKGPLFTVQKALPLMLDGASLILNASIVASKGLPEWSVYSATNAAVRSFTRTWTTDLKDRRIRVNAVSPGFIDTPAWHATAAGEQRLKMLSDSIPLGRPGTANEIAKAVVFLASDDSSYITGQAYQADIVQDGKTEKAGDSCHILSLNAAKEYMRTRKKPVCTTLLLLVPVVPVVFLLIV